MTSLHLLLLLSIFGPTTLCNQAEETTLGNSSAPETTIGVLPSVDTSPTNFTVQGTKEITSDRETSTTTITTDEITETSPKKTTTLTHTTETSTAGTSTEITTSNFTRYPTQSTTAIHKPIKNVTSDPTPKIISSKSQLTSTRNTSALENSTKFTIQEISAGTENVTSDPTPSVISSQLTNTRLTSASKNSTKVTIQEKSLGTENVTSDPTPSIISSLLTSTRNTLKTSTEVTIQEISTSTENVTTDPTPNIISSLLTSTRNTSALKTSTEVTIQEISTVNQTSLTSESTSATPQTQKLTANMTSTPGPSTEPISSQHTSSGPTPAPESTSRNTLTANKTTRIKTTRQTANTTLSKKKQKALKRKKFKPTIGALPKIKSISTTYSATYSRYKWKAPTGRTEPFTKEIDYKESNEFGEESFKKFMIRTGVYVDKSLMIKEFLDHASQVILITRPRYWGKSLNLNMLRKFFEIEVDEGGNILPQEQQINRKIFCGGDINNELVTKLFKPLKIANIPEAMEHQGRHPVIQLNYHFIRGGNYEEMEIGMKVQIMKSFKRHFYLNSYFKSNLHLLDDHQRSQFERYSNGNLTTQDLTHSLRFMSELLYKYFNQTVFVLIDEYDTPLVEAFRQSSEKPENLDKILQFYRLLYTNAFANNPFLAKGFITGKLRIENSNLFVNLTNISEYTLLDHEFNQFYGFTEQEVDELLEPEPSEYMRDEIKSYYRGYNYGGQIMFNPWSIKNCIEHKYEIRLYWLQTGILYPGNRGKYSLAGVQQDIKSLLGGQCIQIPIKNEVTFEGLQDGRNFFNFILFTGYLSPVMKNPNGTYQLVKPNIETDRFYSIILGDWVGQHFGKHGVFGITPTGNRRNCTSAELSGSSNETREDSKSTPWPTTPMQSYEFSFSQRSINFTSSVSSSGEKNERTVVPGVTTEAMTSQTSSKITTNS
ncbi:hypothetical protein U1Q18_050140 [Sarracenia purpurea var. burkii]